MGALLSRTPSPVAMPQMFEGFGGHLQALGVPERARFDSASALVSHTPGVAGQNAANAQLFPYGTDRAAVLGEAAAQWARLDPAPVGRPAAPVRSAAGACPPGMGVCSRCRSG
ncbi:hypothetical protein OG349_10845 [Streptomyces sp. NBC_01317]|uniref:hypothetical protein n=1 Tax=Streptomyces sp. NBC_01317 TaxID=2903822 RepID=UPI002E13BDB0|nr:hypothetical protein OG349_10845 [Streptomyces sp. NBC_01317]